MNVAYLTSARLPSRAANAVQTTKMCAAMAANGHRVSLFSRMGDDCDLFSEYGVPRSFSFEPVAARGRRGTHTFHFLADVRARARAERRDVYFGRDIYGLTMAALEGKPVILEVHRVVSGHAECAAFRLLCAQPSFLKLVVISHGMREEFERKFPVLRNKVVQVLAGAADESDAVVALPWATRPGALQVAYVGHLYRGRGLEVIVAAASSLPGVDFHVLGGEDSDVLRWRREALVPNVHFHGFFPHAQIQGMLSSFDVLVAPYQRQVFVAGGAETSAVMSPLKIFEYMAAGRAIVCSDLPVLREVLTHGSDSILVEPESVEGWVAALDRLQNVDVRGSLGVRAQEKFRKHHTWNARARAALDIEGHPFE